MDFTVHPSFQDYIAAAQESPNADFGPRMWIEETKLIIEIDFMVMLDWEYNPIIQTFVDAYTPVRCGDMFGLYLPAIYMGIGFEDESGYHIIAYKSLWMEEPEGLAIAYRNDDTTFCWRRDRDGNHGKFEIPIFEIIEVEEEDDVLPLA